MRWHSACCSSPVPVPPVDGDLKGLRVILLAFRAIGLFCALWLGFVPMARAEPLLIAFTAMIGANNGNVVDVDNVFGEGSNDDLTGQVIVGQVTIDPALLTTLSCGGAGACYGDFGAGAVSVSFSLNGVTSTTVSTGTLGYLGNSSGGSVQIGSSGLGNYLAAGAASSDGMLQQSIGALFSIATLFSASSDPGSAIASLLSIGRGQGLVNGGITLMTPDEHIDATILTINVPEPAALALMGVALPGLAFVRRKRHA